MLTLFFMTAQSFLYQREGFYSQRIHVIVVSREGEVSSFILR